MASPTGTDDPVEGDRSAADGDGVVTPDEVLTAEEVADGPEPRLPSSRTAAFRELARFLPDVARLLARLAREPRVPWHAKAIAAGAVAYVLSPVDVIPEFLGPVGQVDDVYLVTKALRHLFNTAGYDVVRQHWAGSDDGFALLLIVAGIDR